MRETRPAGPEMAAGFRRTTVFSASFSLILYLLFAPVLPGRCTVFCCLIVPAGASAYACLALWAVGRALQARGVWRHAAWAGVFGPVAGAVIGARLSCVICAHVCGAAGHLGCHGCFSPCGALVAGAASCVGLAIYVLSDAAALERLPATR